MDKCPFCGALLCDCDICQQTEMSINTFKCGTTEDCQSWACEQIAQLTERLEAWRGLKGLIEFSRENYCSWKNGEILQKLRDLGEVE